MGSTRVVGIIFHAIGVPSKNLTSEEQPYAITRDMFLSLLDEIAMHPEVQVSFDDGFASDIETALPALVERNLSANFFPVAGRLEQAGFVDRSGIRTLASAGMTIGSHGMKHVPWRGLDHDSIHSELAVAKSLIAEAAGCKVTIAACPFGSYDRRVLSALRQYGYEKVFTSDRRHSQHDAWLQPRYGIRCSDTVQTIKEGILSPPPLYDQIRRTIIGRFKAWR